MGPPYGPVTLIFCIDPKNMKTLIGNHVCTSVFIAMNEQCRCSLQWMNNVGVHCKLFTIAEIGKQHEVCIEGWMDKDDLVKI